MQVFSNIGTCMNHMHNDQLTILGITATHLMGKTDVLCIDHNQALLVS